MQISSQEWFGLAIMALACGFAAWRGEKLERRAAAVIATAWILSVILDQDGHQGVQWGIFTIDVLLLGYLLHEAIFSKRVWPIFATAAHMFIVLTHASFLIDSRIEQWGFFTAYYIWSYVVLLALFAGSAWRPGPAGQRA